MKPEAHDQPIAPAEPPPDRVARTAEVRGLGAVVTWRRRGNPVGKFVFWVVVAAVLFGVAVLLNWVLGHVRLRVLALLAVVCVIFAILALIGAVVEGAQGFTADYLNAGGLVHTRNWRVTVVTWPEVDELILHRAAGTVITGKLLGVHLTTFGGRKVWIEAKGKEADDILLERLRTAVRGIARPVRDHRPTPG